MTHAVQATPPDEPGRRHLLRPVVVNSPLGPVLTLSIRGMTDTRTTRRTSDNDDAGDTRKASTRSDTDAGTRSDTPDQPATASTNEPAPAISYAGNGSGGTELLHETHGRHYRGSYGDV